MRRIGLKNLSNRIKPIESRGYKTGCPGIKPGQSPQNAEKMLALWLDLTFIFERMY
jgi:hypothetical protein